MIRFVIIAACAAVTLAATSDTASAAKEKFVRNKPHINIGTIGSIGSTEGATASIRLNVPSVDDGQGPVCQFEGLAILSTNLPDRGTPNFFLPKVKIEVVLDDPTELILIPLDIQPAVGSRVHYLFEVSSNYPDTMDQCGLDIVIDVFDLATGVTRARHTPFKSTYRPQFYIRTPDVTGD